MSNPFLFYCNKCKNKCDGISKMKYIFEKDTSYSEKFEDYIVEIINKNTDKKAKKTVKEGYPDIKVMKNDNISCFVEVKAQRRTFMAVSRLLPKSDLYPSDTIALNLSDLVRYFCINNETKIPIFLVWVLSNRPCILHDNDDKLYFQDVKILEEIYKKYGNTRRFKRKSGYGDIINGQHKGVVVNYHFSLNELNNNFDDLLNIIVKN